MLLNAVTRFPRLTLAALLLLAGALPAADSFHVIASSPGNTPATEGLRFYVLTASEDERELVLRVGVLNQRNASFTGSSPLDEDAIKLAAAIGDRRLVSSPTTITLDDLLPSGPFPYNTAHTGIFTFPGGTRAFHIVEADKLVLTVPGFAPLPFACLPSQKFDPLDWATVTRLSHLNIEVMPKASNLAIMPMRLLSLIAKPDALEFEVAFRNVHRTPIVWTGTLNGTQATLQNAQGERFPPSEVSDSLRTRIAPPGKTWAVGEDNIGWIRFPLPHPHSAERLTFSLPGYGNTGLTFDHATKAWQVDPASAAIAASMPPPVQQLLIEEKEFAAMRTFWETQARLFNEQRYEHFLAPFRGKALEEMRVAIQRWAKVPGQNVEFKLSARQDIKPDADGRQRSVRVQMRYTIGGLPKDNLFIDRMEIDMQRDDTGAWHVDFVFFPIRQPFWKIGYTSFTRSEHFLMFYRAELAESPRIVMEIEQLERAYTQLARTGLPLKTRYAAFLLTSKDDFANVTRSDPLMVSGAALMAHEYEQGRVVTVNQAMCLNEDAVGTLNREWAMREHYLTRVHELVHLALADMTSLWSPPWLVEGTAMYFSGQADDATRRHLREHLTPMTTLRTMSLLAGISSGTNDREEIRSRYGLGTEAVRWIVRNHGEAALIAYYVAFGGHTIPPEWTDAKDNHNDIANAQLRITERLTHTVFPGLTLDLLDANARAALRQ